MECLDDPAEQDKDHYWSLAVIVFTADAGFPLLFCCHGCLPKILQRISASEKCVAVIINVIIEMTNWSTNKTWAWSVNCR